LPTAVSPRPTTLADGYVTPTTIDSRLEARQAGFQL